MRPIINRVMPKRTSKTGSELFIVDNSDITIDPFAENRQQHTWMELS